MKDRIPLYPGRVKLTPVDGQANTYDMVRADEPTQIGTPLNKATLLKDTTAARFGLDENATPDDAFSALCDRMFEKLVIQKIENSMTWTAPKATAQLFKIMACGGGGGGSSYHDSNDTTSAGGGGGYVTIETVEVPVGTEVEVICGAGGTGGTRDTDPTDGGATSFGDYVTAAGGKAPPDHVTGGDGGAGGGGGYYNGNSGNGGNGGTYGGGGGGGAGGTTQGDGGTGGAYGGHGGSKMYRNNGSAAEQYGYAAEPGKQFSDPFINILFKLDLISAIRGDAGAGGGGGGGYGGNGGNTSGNGGGGGGGYCGNGGMCANGSCGGGGGGYCGNGGKADSGGAGGGGGLFANGGDCRSTYGSGGGAGIKDGGKSGGSSGSSASGGSGGDGGLYILYFKEDEHAV